VSPNPSEDFQNLSHWLFEFRSWSLGVISKDANVSFYPVRQVVDIEYLYLYILVLLVVDGLCSQSAVYAHITPVSIQSVLKSID